MTATEINDLIPVIATNLVLVGGGLMAGYFKLKSQMRNQITEVKNHADVNMQKLNGMLTSVIHSFDRPAWLKVARFTNNGDVEFRMMEVNESYASTYGISRQEYIGKTDLEAGWDRAIAEKFRNHDMLVWASGEPTTFVEEIDKKTRFRKIRIQSPDGMLKGILGYAVDCGSPETCPVYAKPELKPHN